MKSLRPRIASFLLAILVLCSTFSFAVEKMYCHGEVVDYSFFGLTDSSCDDVSEGTVLAETCCSNVQELVKASNDELQVPFQEDVQPVLSFLHTTTYFLIDLVSDTEHTTYDGYDPPEVTRDIQVQYQTFLI